jgi:SecD/SecF fusion protein
MPWHVSFPLAQAAAERQSIPWYLNLLAALGVIVVSIVLGNYLGRKLRMKEHGWKISLIFFTLLASVAILLMGPPLKYGIDLSGGVILIYEVDQEKKPKGQSVDMNELIAAIKRRVNPGGQKEVTVRTHGVEQVEIIVPEVEEAEVKRIERIITTTGNLQFRILANDRDDKELIERARADDPNNEKMAVQDADGNLLAWWVPMKEGKEEGIGKDKDVCSRVRTKGKRQITEVLVIPTQWNITGSYLTEARTGSDRQGRPCVNFTFNDEGGRLFGELTTEYKPQKTGAYEHLRRLGIILDDEMYSAPVIQSPIFTHGEITGNFSEDEVKALVNVLNAGRLPAALTKEPISKLYSDATLGADTIEKSTKAMIISAILVPIFMIWYYRFSGVVAVIALTLNMTILLAIMLSIKAAFTLTGFAGLALTVGMAVDNNVLVYERLREELARGAALRMAIRNAFQRASSTIIDANLTTMITATVLYVIGTDQLKGFAVPLWLGVTLSIFTSVFVARVIFDVAEKRRWITKVKMMHLIGRTNIDFMRLFPVTLTISLVFIVLALAVSFQRGRGLFDIDFTGGVSVQALFNKPQDTGEVRKLLSGRPEATRLPDLAVSGAQLADEEKGLRFVINTSEKDLAKVKQELTATFGDKLARNKLDFTPPELIPEAPANAKAGEKSEPGGKTTEKNPFAGGSRTVLTFARPINHESVLQYLVGALGDAAIPPEAAQLKLSAEGYFEGDKTDRGQWTVETLLKPDRLAPVLDGLKAKIDIDPIFPSSNEIGTTVAGNTQLLAIYALVVSWLCIIVYLWIRFQGMAFGLAAVVALIHDVLIMLGAVAVSIYFVDFVRACSPYLDFLNVLMVEPFKINLPIVAAFLTIIGFSVNDTIVIFDRIREVRGKNPDLTSKMINDSVNQTLSRTLLTSFTVLLVVVVLYIFGGDAVHGFSFALLVGVVTGTYSSVYIAAPILLWLIGKREPGQGAAKRDIMDLREANAPSHRG